MEKELGREFGVFPLEPCPRRGAARAGPPDTAAEWPLPTAASLLLPAFISGIFQPFPLRGAFPSRFPSRGAGRERGEVGIKQSQEPPWEVGNQGADSGHQTRSCCQFVMFSLKSQRFNGERGQALT